MAPGDRNALSHPQVSIAALSFIEIVSVCEAVVLLSQNPVSHRFHEHNRALNARQVDIASEALDKLLDGHMIPAPQRDFI